MSKRPSIRYVPPPGTTPWRVGTKVGRTLYDCEGRLVGVVDSPDMARMVVEAINGYFGKGVEPNFEPRTPDRWPGR